MRSSENASSIEILVQLPLSFGACRCKTLSMRPCATPAPPRSRPARPKRRPAGDGLGRGGCAGPRCAARRSASWPRRPWSRHSSALWVVVLRADDSPSPPVPVPDVPVTTGAPIPGGRVEYSQPGNVTEAYRAVAGPDDGVAARGDAACARGVPEERAWSKPERARGRSRSLPVSPRRRARGNVVDRDRYGRARARSARGRRSRCTFHLVARPARRRERRGSLTRTGSRW